MICTSDEEASRLLAGLGYAPWDDYLVSPLLLDQRPALELDGCQARLPLLERGPGV